MIRLLRGAPLGALAHGGPTMNDDRQRHRRSVILALIHVLLVIAIVAGFVYVKMQK